MIAVSRVVDSNHCVVRYHCPACGARDVTGNAWTRVESQWLLGLIPVFFHTTNWVQANCCRQPVVSKLLPALFSLQSPDDIESAESLKKNLSMTTMIVTALSIFFACIPILGGAISILGYWINRNESRLIRSINLIGLVLNVFFSALHAYWYFTEDRFS